MKRNKLIGYKMHNIAPALLISAVLGLSSCNFLDFDQSLGYESQEEVYEVFSRAEQSLSQLYTYLESDFGSIGGAMRDCAIDDAHYVWTNSIIHTFTNGRWSPTNTIDEEWSNYYTGIRACNQFIKSIEETDFSIYEWNDDYESWVEKSQYWIYEARFLRSLYHFELARRYGDIPLAKDIYTIESVNELKKTKFSDVIDYIATECKEIADKLPLSYNDVEGKQTGRITRGAALALRARALLYKASPLHSENDQNKWAAAALAAHDVIALNQYQLVNEESVNNLNSRELILERRAEPSNSFEKLNFPISFEKGNTGTCPSQNLVDAFQTVNGYDVILTETGWESDDTSFDSKNPYKNRDPRFYKTVLYDGAVFKGLTMQCYEGGKDGLPVNGASETGYYLKKYVIEDINLSPKESTMYHYWVLFRYAEVLLNYAEAMNKAFGADFEDDTYTLSATDAINIVRTRAGMPKISTGLDIDTFQALLERERRVELAFENHRFWDLRRWKKQPSTSLDGVKIIQDEAGKTYSRVVVENRTWDDKMFLYPIPQTELFKNVNLNPQNQGW